MEKQDDVDLYEELRKTLETSDESEEKDSSVASDQKPEEVDTSKETVTEEKPAATQEEESTELSEEDISKLSPRAQKRIRDQADEIKRLATLAETQKVAPEDTKEDETAPQGFKNVNEFLAAVQDEPSRNLLAKFAEVLKAENSAILAPIEQKNNETKFETEFSKYEKIDGLADYKNNLRKTFLRNPNQSLKSLIGEVVTDLQLSKVKPIEKTPSTPNRGKVDTDNLSKDELYDMLDTFRE